MMTMARRLFALAIIANFVFALPALAVAPSGGARGGGVSSGGRASSSGARSSSSGSRSSSSGSRSSSANTRSSGAAPGRGRSSAPQGGRYGFTGASGYARPGVAEYFTPPFYAPRPASIAASRYYIDSLDYPFVYGLFAPSYPSWVYGDEGADDADRVGAALWVVIWSLVAILGISIVVIGIAIATTGP